MEIPKIDMKYIVILALLLEMASLLVSPIKDYLVWEYSGVFQSDKIYVARSTLNDTLRYTVDGINHPTDAAYSLTTVVFRHVELARSIAYTVGFDYDPEAMWSVKTDRALLKPPSEEYLQFVEFLQARLADPVARTTLLTMCSSAATSFNIGGGCWFQDTVDYTVTVEDLFMYLVNQMNPVPVGVVFGTKARQGPATDVDVAPGAPYNFSMGFAGGFDGIQLSGPRRLNTPVMATLSTSIEANLCLRNFTLENLMMARIDPTWVDMTTLRTFNYTKQDPLFMTKAMLPDVAMYLQCQSLPTFRERYNFLRDAGLREIYSRESFVLLTNLFLNIAQYLPGIEDLIEPIAFEGERVTVPSFKKEKNIFFSPAVVQMERNVISRGLDTSVTPFLGTNDIALGLPFWHGWYFAGWVGNRTKHNMNEYGMMIARQIPRALDAYEYIPLAKFPDQDGVVRGTKHPLVGVQATLTPPVFVYNTFSEFLTTYWDVSSFNAHMKSLTDRYNAFPPGSMTRRPGWAPGYPEYNLADGAPYYLTTAAFARGRSSLNLTQRVRKAYYFQNALSEMYTFDNAPDFKGFMQKLFLLFQNVDGALPKPYNITQSAYNTVNYVLTDLPCAFMSGSAQKSATLGLTFWGVDDGGFCSSLVPQDFQIRQDIYDTVAQLIQDVTTTTSSTDLARMRTSVIALMERWETESNTDLTMTPREMLLFDDAKTQFGYAKGDLRKLYLFVLSPNLVGRKGDTLVPNNFRFFRRAGDIIYRTEVAFGDKSVEGGVKFLTILSIVSSLLNAIWTAVVLIFPNILAVLKAKTTKINKEEFRVLRAIDLTSAAFFSPILLPFNFISAFIPAVRVVNSVTSRQYSVLEVFVIILTCWRLAVAVLFCISRSHLPSRLIWMLSVIVAAVMIGLGEAGVGDEFENYSRAVILAIVTFLVCLGLFMPFSYLYTKKYVMQIREEGITATLGIKVAHVDRATLYQGRRMTTKPGELAGIDTAVAHTDDVDVSETVSIITALELAAKHKTACLIDFSVLENRPEAVPSSHGESAESRANSRRLSSGYGVGLRGMFSGNRSLQSGPIRRDSKVMSGQLAAANRASQAADELAVAAAAGAMVEEDLTDVAHPTGSHENETATAPPGTTE